MLHNRSPTMTAAAAIAIERVRVHAGADALDPGVARVRLEQALGTSALRPPGLAPSALLCVRRLADPRPGTLRLGSGGERPPPEWEAAFVAALERLRRDAARPAHGPVPATAQAVLFADRAELLACLARDAGAGWAASRWWWRGVLRRAPGARDAAVGAWLESPSYAPAAMELLASDGAAAPFASVVVQLGAAMELVARVAVTFDARELGAALRAHDGGGVSAASGRSQALVRPVAPWGEVGDEIETPHTAEPIAQLLVGVLLALRRAPALARSAAFVRATQQWLRATIEETSSSVRGATLSVITPSVRFDPVTPTSTVEDDPDDPDDRAPAPAGGGERQPDVAPPASAATRHRQPRNDAAPRSGLRFSPMRQRRRLGSETPGAAAPSTTDPEPVPLLEPLTDPAAPKPPPHEGSPRAPAEPAAAQVTSSGEASRSADPARSPWPTGDGSRGSPPATPEPAPVSWESPEPGIALIATAFGGLFYLLNLALALELYPDFSRPGDPGIALAPWDLLTLLGERLLGSRSPDPVWDLLADLAGRDPEDPPGGSFRPPRAWRVPRDWLAPFDPGGAWRWSSAAGELRIMHPAGFLVAAVPLTADAELTDLLGRELRRAGHRTSGRSGPVALRAALSREPRGELARWTNRLAAYTEARLRLALDLEDGESPVELLLAHRARVIVSPTHVDVVLSLDELPIAIRLAGLDRDPGWIPAAGRHLAFHFE